MTQHEHATRIEQFLTQFSTSLPTHFTDGTLRIETSAPFWRALILTYGDRYGQSVEVAKAFPGIVGDPDWRRPLAKCIKGAVKHTKQVRARLSLRMDTERVQMQRPLEGRSLLSLTTCMDPRFSRALRALVILAIHPEHGVEGYRVTSGAYKSVPFLLPKCLQDKLPVLGPINDANPGETTFSPDRIRELDVIVPAPKLTAFIRRIFEAREDAFVSFVTRILPTRFAWNALGSLPSQFDPLVHGFVIKVPFVKAGKQVILWSTWHATAGSSRELANAKATAFVDLVPRRFFVDPQDLEWFRYCTTHAPTDPGSGSSRGAYLSFLSMVVDIANGRRSPDASYGLPEAYLNMFDTGLRADAIDADDYRGSGTLTHKQISQFYDTGYLILDIPETLSARLPPTESISSFTQFFQNISGDDAFGMNSLHRVLDMKTAEQDVGDRFAYFSRGIPTNDPLNPFAHGRHSHNPQRGGKLIAMDCGMGKGSTYVSDPNHIAFQYSSFVYNVLSSFYYPGRHEPLIVVPERFRFKTTSAWTNGTHVDNSTSKLIPILFHVYQQVNGLPSFK
jgi:hypothetical protein